MYFWFMSEYKFLVDIEGFTENNTKTKSETIIVWKYRIKKTKKQA